MEPSTPERKIVLVQPTEPVALADTAMIPEVLAGFTESILIDDDDETGLVTGIPSASGVAETSTVSAEPFGTATSQVAPARDPKKVNYFDGYRRDSKDSYETSESSHT